MKTTNLMNVFGPTRPIGVSGLALLTALVIHPAYAHEGHDHGPAPQPATPLAARAEARTELFEVLAVREAGGLRLYVDRADTNEPAASAALELEAGGKPWPLKPLGEGVFRVEAPALAAPGRHALGLTVTAGEEMDLVSMTLEVPVGEPTGTPAAPAAPHWPWVGGGALLLALASSAAWLTRRRRGRASPWMGLTVVLALVLATGAGPSQAHGGEDHSHAAPAPAAGAGESPSRLADGSVFVPKSAQRALGLRTVPARTGEHVAALELRGTLMADPSAGGRVQAPFSGRLEAPPAGFPRLGARVRRGQVLGWLEPAGSALERAGAREKLAELEASIRLAERRVARLNELEGSVPARDIEAARVEAGALKARRTALAGGVSGREALRAPVDGVVANIAAVAGQVVDARDTLFDVVDPARLMVEALAWASPAAGFGPKATARLADGRTLGLTLVGASQALQNQALPVRYAVDSPPAGLMVGAPVTVLAGTGVPATGQALPAAALRAGGQVWLHESAERFVPRSVTSQLLDASRVLVTAGLGEGERVVVQGAVLLEQVR